MPCTRSVRIMHNVFAEAGTSFSIFHCSSYFGNLDFNSDPSCVLFHGEKRTIIYVSPFLGIVHTIIIVKYYRSSAFTYQDTSSLRLNSCRIFPRYSDLRPQRRLFCSIEQWFKPRQCPTFQYRHTAAVLTLINKLLRELFILKGWIYSKCRQTQVRMIWISTHVRCFPKSAYAKLTACKEASIRWPMDKLASPDDLLSYSVDMGNNVKGRHAHSMPLHTKSYNIRLHLSESCL